jgi:hypothetical protein
MERADRYLIGTEDPNLDPAFSIPSVRQKRQRSQENGGYKIGYRR